MSHPLAAAMPLAQHLGVEVRTAEKDRVVGRLEVRPELCTVGGALHGGAIMAFADTLGAIAGFLNLPEGAAGTTTTESKTNFLGPAKVGAAVIGETTPVHVGKRLSVWQTFIATEDGRPVALVIQSQMVL